MKKILFLFLLPGLSHGFQSEVSGARVTYDSGNELYATSYIGNIKYYFSELEFNDKPFKEIAFLNAVSSADFFFAKSDFEVLSSLNINSIMKGLSAVLYYKNLALDVSYSNLETTSDALTFQYNSSTYSIEPGLRIGDTNMLYGVYENQIQNDFIYEERTKTYGIGFKTVLDNANIVLQYSKSESDQLVTNTEFTGILLEYYLTNFSYVGVRYITETEELTNDFSTATFSLGGLIEKQLSYEFAYSESTLDFDEKETSVYVEIGVNF